MSTSGICRAAKWNRRPLIIFLAVSVLCVIVTNVYALFGHGIRSDAMDRMFLYPLAGGLLGYAPLGLFSAGSKLRYGRLGRNLYNAGIATLTAGAMLQGILEIAGTASGYTMAFSVAGWGLTAAGAALSLVFHPKKGVEMNGH